MLPRESFGGGADVIGFLIKENGSSIADPSFVIEVSRAGVMTVRSDRGSVVLQTVASAQLGPAVVASLMEMLDDACSDADVLKARCWPADPHYNRFRLGINRDAGAFSTTFELADLSISLSRVNVFMRALAKPYVGPSVWY